MGLRYEGVLRPLAPQQLTVRAYASANRDGLPAGHSTRYRSVPLLPLCLLSALCMLTAF